MLKKISKPVRQQKDATVDKDLGKSGIVKQKRLRSEVWEDFLKYKEENGNDKAICKACERLFDGSSKKGTSHLKNHSRSCKRKSHGCRVGELNHLNEMRRIIVQDDASSLILSFPNWHLNVCSIFMDIKHKLLHLSLYNFLLSIRTMTSKCEDFRYVIHLAINSLGHG